MVMRCACCRLADIIQEDKESALSWGCSRLHYYIKALRVYSVDACWRSELVCDMPSMHLAMAGKAVVHTVQALVT